MLSKAAKKRNKIIYALLINCGVIGVTLLMSIFTFSVAWFSNNKTVKTNGMITKVKVDPCLLSIDYELYKYDRDIKSGVKYIQNSENIDLSLNQFDNFIRERNANNNNILKFTVSFLGTSEYTRSLSLDIKCLESVIGEEFDNGYETTSVERTHLDAKGYQYKTGSSDSKYICNNISNVISFKILPYSYTIEDVENKFDIASEITIDESTDALIYSSATTAFKALESIQFASETDKTNTNLNYEIHNIPAGVSKVIYYVEYNYDTDLIDAFLSPNEIITNSGIDMLDTNATISFLEDIEYFEFKTEEEISNE